MSSYLSPARVERFKSFYNYLLTVRNNRKSTISTSLLAISFFFDRYDILNRENVESLIVELKSSGKMNAYINNLLGAIKVYLHFLEYNELPFDANIRKIKKLKEEYAEKDIMSDDEIERFLSFVPQQRRGFNRKNYDIYTVFFTICAYSGMRPGEVAHLTVNDIDWGRNVFILRQTKTVPRLVPIAPNIKNMVQKHLKNCTDYLFPSKKSGYDGVISDVDWGYNFHTRIKALGMSRPNRTVYSLRHSFITSLLSEDVSIFKVQKIVGHRRIDTTARYTHLVTKDMQNVILKHPYILRSGNPEETINALKEMIQAYHLEKNSSIEYKTIEKNGEFGFSIKVKK